MSPAAPAEPSDAAVTDERLRKAAEFVEEEEGAVSRFRGWLGTFTTAALVVMSVFHLYAALEIVPAQVLRPVHVGFVLVLVFLLFPIAGRYRNRLMWWDVVCAVAGAATIVYLLQGGDEFWTVTPHRRTPTSRSASCSCCSCSRRAGARRDGSSRSS